jgi:glycosyltransferase involved in cell wall biosynthesis
MAALSPRPNEPTHTEGPIVVAGFFNTASGLGESARLCLNALRGSGTEAYGIDLSSALMQGSSVIHQFATAPRSSEPGTLILHVNPPLVPMALFRLGRRVVRNKRIIGFWHWELPRLPNDWLRDFDYIHEVWVPSAFTASAVRAVKRMPVFVVRHPVQRGHTVDMLRHRPVGVDLLVLTMFNFRSGFTRKNPLAALAAFAAAFDGDRRAHLLIKSLEGAAHPAQWRELQAAAAGIPNVTLLDAVLSPAETSGLIEMSDVILSLHRSEGFGLVPAEAMLRGKPVVATNFSGTVDFLNSRNGSPVDYQLVPAIDPQGVYNWPDQLWAEPNIESAAAALRRLRDPGLRAAIGLRAAADAAGLFAASVYATRVAELLGKLGAKTTPAEP